MFNYKRLNSKNNAKNALREILSNGVCKADLRFVIYHLSENHVECASDEGGPSAVAKYALSGDTVRAMQRDCSNGCHAVLAYNMRTNEVFLLDAVPELPVASCVLLCVMNILVGVEDAHKPYSSFEAPKRPSVDNYVTAAPRPATRAVRDSATGRFMRLEEKQKACEEDDILGRRFRIGRHA